MTGQESDPRSQAGTRAGGQVPEDLRDALADLRAFVSDELETRQASMDWMYVRRAERALASVKIVSAALSQPVGRAGAERMPADPEPPAAAHPRDEKMVFALGTAADGLPLVILGMPRAAWEYTKDGKTHHFDFRRAGLGLRLVLFGGASHAGCKKAIEDLAAASGTALLDMRGKDFGIKTNGGGDADGD